MRKVFTRRCAAVAVWAVLSPALHAQTAPAAAEAARYQGLHAAAHEGDAARIVRLAGSGADVNARDPHGRTPLRVAAFARQREAIRALAAAGAGLDLLENDRYDAVTIAHLQLADRQGRRPIELAQARGFTEMVRILQQAGPR